jgi:hypothetical protein
MKKVLLSIVLGISTIALFAQIPVPTTPQNKKAIIEEYTGIHCGYCPDGHKIAQLILTNNPGNAFMVAIHTGSYATPGAGEPDYRTAYGTALATQTLLTGYPAGTVNRHNFGHGMVSGGQGTGESRSYWTADATTMMGQASYLNVGVSAQVDYATRVLTVHCQVYYTANSTVTSNKLNIVLLQNNVKGPQSGSSANPTMVTPDGQYLHQHMLREMFTGQWGKTISNTNTAVGTLKVDTTFTYTVPAAFTSVPVNLAELEVVAFVAEGNQEIISGSGAHVNPPTVDAGITAVTGLPSSIQCSYAGITPVVELKNLGTNVLTSAVINYSIDGGAAVSQNWTGSLASGATTNVTITNTIIPSNGPHVVSYFTTLPNGVADMNSFNDATSGPISIFTVYSPSLVNEEFTATAFPPTNWVIAGTGWSRATTSSFGTGSGSAKMDFFNTADTKTGDLYVYGLDFSAGTSHYITFDHAYAQYSTENDHLQVQVSTNCGSTWTSVFDKQGATLSTAAATTSAFTPTAAQWVHDSIDMSAYNQGNLIIRFHTTSNFGNNLYIDKVKTGGTGGYVISELKSINNISVYPNPATDIVNIINAENSNIQLYDVYGKLVASDNVSNNNYSLNVSEYAIGTYILKITNSEGSISKKITVLK